MNRKISSFDDNSGLKDPILPDIRTCFSGYEPPFDPVPIVRRMLQSISNSYLIGLNEVVLTNTTALARKRRRSVSKSRGRKVSIIEAGGLYHPATNGCRAWVEIFMDNTLRGWETGWWLKIPILREAKIGDVLFHEIGHHIHFSHRPEHREREDVADVWKVRLQNQYSKNRFGSISRLASLIRPMLGPFIDRQRASVELRLLRAGQISRAEYNESIRTLKSGKS